MKLIIDVDTGIDDALALLYVLASPEAELLAVTCTSGNVEAGQVAENTIGLLDLAGRSDVEVAFGRRDPLVRPLMTAPETHGPKGIGYATLPRPARSVSARHSADLIVEEARRAPGEVTLITLAPLTNVAVALEREPALPSLLQNMVMMAGSYRSPGNTAPTSEWNTACDPEAMQAVISAWESAEGVSRPVVLGLDVTERAKFLPDHLAQLHAAAGDPQANPVLQFIDDALRFYMEFHSRYDGFYGAFVHDPLAVASALDPALLKTEALAVQVELDGKLTSGETVTDWRRVWGRPANLDIGVAAEIETFFARFIERVGGLAARAA
jgi:purine nucleosidase